MHAISEDVKGCRPFKMPEKGRLVLFSALVHTTCALLDFRRNKRARENWAVEIAFASCLKYS